MKNTQGTTRVTGSALKAVATQQGMKRWEHKCSWVFFSNTRTMPSTAPNGEDSISVSSLHSSFSVISVGCSVLSCFRPYRVALPTGNWPIWMCDTEMLPNFDYAVGCFFLATQVFRFHTGSLWREDPVDLWSLIIPKNLSCHLLSPLLPVNVAHPMLCKKILNHWPVFIS